MQFELCLAVEINDFRCWWKLRHLGRVVEENDERLEPAYPLVCPARHVLLKITWKVPNCFGWNNIYRWVGWCKQIEHQVDCSLFKEGRLYQLSLCQNSETKFVLTLGISKPNRKRSERVHVAKETQSATLVSTVFDEDHTTECSISWFDFSC